KCTGTSGTCPADVKVPAGTVCRPSAGPCDPNAEACDGTSANCPADVLAPSGTVCSPPSCSSGSETLAAACTGSAASCPAPVVQPCGAYVCGATDCLSTCTTNADCASGYFCSGNVCTLKLDLGSACSASTDCKSSFCADGVCCNRACGG